ncbi:MAG: hypothetical protein NVS1B4_21620 [Gemmatimonadaceae bacterium]
MPHRSGVPRFTVSPDALAAHLPGEAVVLNVSTRQYFRLNATAAAVVTVLAQESDPDDIVDRVCDEFEVERAVAAREVDRTLTELVTHGLVVRHED